MWLDTHLHLDADEYGGAQSTLIASAAAQGVCGCLIPAVWPANFELVRALAHATPGAVYALGIHPLYVSQCPQDALDQLRDALMRYANDPKLVAVGEIGLDYFVPNQDLALQQYFLIEQLKLARRHHLPVILHVRRSVDHIAKYLRQWPVCSGVAHAFNGSAQQAQHLINLGLGLGFGGAATYSRALQIRERLRNIPEAALLLETDGPDIAPEWLSGQVNPPSALSQIGQVLAKVRGLPVSDFAALTCANSLRILPRWQAVVSM